MFTAPNNSVKILLQSYVAPIITYNLCCIFRRRRWGPGVWDAGGKWHQYCTVLVYMDFITLSDTLTKGMYMYLYVDSLPSRSLSFFLIVFPYTHFPSIFSILHPQITLLNSSHPSLSRLASSTLLNIYPTQVLSHQQTTTIS